MTAENKLSDKALRVLLGKVQTRQKMIADGKGLSVRVSKHGAVSFVFFSARVTEPRLRYG